MNQEVIHESSLCFENLDFPFGLLRTCVLQPSSWRSLNFTELLEFWNSARLNSKLLENPVDV
jgi:hypothetical protein